MICPILKPKSMVLLIPAVSYVPSYGDCFGRDMNSTHQHPTQRKSPSFPDMCYLLVSDRGSSYLRRQQSTVWHSPGIKLHSSLLYKTSLIFLFHPQAHLIEVSLFLLNLLRLLLEFIVLQDLIMSGLHSGIHLNVIISQRDVVGSGGDRFLSWKDKVRNRAADAQGWKGLPRGH